MKINISVCGSDGDDNDLGRYALEVAETVGKCIAKRGGVLVCGGRGGVMEAACRGGLLVLVMWLLPLVEDGGH